MSMAEDDRAGVALETALWCNTCFLPSGMRMPSFFLDPSTGIKTPGGSYVYCFDCEQMLDPEGNPID